MSSIQNKLIRGLVFLLTSIFLFLGMPDLASSEETYVFERMWPTLQQPWYFSNPIGISINKTEYVFIADKDNHRILKFTLDGQFVGKWGNQGNGDGEFDRPFDVAVDPDGFVYVADEQNHRIQKFTSNGEFVSKWSGLTSGEGSFFYPRGIAADNTGFIYVTDVNYHKVLKFTTDGEFVKEWGSLGTGDGEFNYPYGIAVDENSVVFVVDLNNARIQKFTSEGQFLDKWGSLGKGDGEFYYPAYIALDSKGFVYVTESGQNHRIQKFTADGVFVARWGGLGWNNGEFFNSEGIVLDAQDNVYVVDSINNRIQKFTDSAIFLDKWGGLGQGDGEFNDHRGMAFDGNDFIYVADTLNHRIQKFTADGVFIQKWGNKGSANGEFNSPTGVAIDSNGFVYVTDSNNNRIQKFTSEGVFVLKWGSYGFGDGQFWGLREIAVDSGNFVYVTDGNNHRVQKFTSDGVFVDKWGSQGSAAGQFYFPEAIGIDSADNIYIADSFNQRIQKFTSSGVFLDEWGTYGNGNGQFEWPFGLAIDRNDNDNIYVSDITTHRIQKFNANGEFITAWGNIGNSPGEVNGPWSLAVPSNGNVYVGDRYNYRIQVFRKITSNTNNKAIVVAGGGAFASNNLWESTQMSANFAYRAMTYQGFTKESIYYLSSDTDLDLDNNGVSDDVDGDATNSNLQDAIVNWASDADGLLIYLVDHGGGGTFRMSGTETLSVADLDTWLDNLQTNISGNVTIIYDACESGSFASSLVPPPGKERIVITSTSPEESAYFVSQGSISFSNYFWTHVFNGESIKNAFDLASQAIQVTTEYQHPLLEADGDGVANETEDFNLVENTYIGNGTVIHGDAPVIASVFDPVIINETATFLLTASDVTDNDGIARVWAVIRPPDYNQGSSDNPVQELPSVDLMPMGNDQYEILYEGFNIEGTYQIVIYARDRIGNTSIPKLSTVTVNNPLTRKAIIVAGGEQSDTLWPAIEKNAKMAIEALSFQGYSNEDLYLMSPASIPGVTITIVLPTLSNLEYAITTWASEQTQDVAVYLIGNGGPMSFEMNETETLSAMDLDTWLDMLQNQIPGKVTVINDANESGSFLPLLTPPAGKERIIISSANANQSAYFISQGDISFSKFFWRRVLNGTNLKDSFTHAKNAMQYCQDQTPLLDDNGNGIGNEKQDGQVARNYTLGVGIMLAGDDPVIGSVSPGQTLYGTHSAVIWAENITTTGTIDKVWAVISPPGNPNSEPPSIELIYNASFGRYEGTYNDFSLYGTYNIAIYAMDSDRNVSLPLTTTVTQEIGPDVYEDDDAIGEANVITLDDTEAQTHTFHDAGDQDWVKFYAIADETYEIKTNNLGSNCDTVIILYDSNGIQVTDPQDDNFYGEDELLSWQCPSDGIYYVMVKQYDSNDFGQNTNYDLRVYHPTAAWPGKLLGRVMDVGGNGIGGALVRPNIVNATALSLPNGYYLLFLPPGTYMMTASAEGFESQVQIGVVVTDLNAAALDFKLAISVDINGDGKTDLADAIIALQALAGFDISGRVRTGYAATSADINGDYRIGIEEAIFILQRIANLRNP